MTPQRKWWRWSGYFQSLGNYVLMMFYTTVGGWMISYFVKMFKGEFQGVSPTSVAQIFDQSLQDPFYKSFG